MKKISLEKRIRRLKSGMCSSQEHILPGLSRFADLPVAAVLEKLFDDLLKYFGNFMDLNFRKPFTEISYGDLAVIIASDYMNKGIHSDRVIDSLILLYFSSMEIDACFRSFREKFHTDADKEQYLEKLGLADVRCFSNLRLGEYLSAVQDLDLPESVAKKLYAFRLEKAGVMSKTMQDIYLDLSMHASNFDKAIIDPLDSGFVANSLMIRERLIELFVIPVACLTAKKGETR